MMTMATTGFQGMTPDKGAALDRAARARGRAKLNLNQAEEMAEQELDRLGLTGLARAKRKFGMIGGMVGKEVIQGK
jgi:hypothetical protein